MNKIWEVITLCGEWLLAKVSHADAEWITYMLTEQGLEEVRGE